MRALSKTPGARYASARTLVSALREAYDGRRPPTASAKRTSIRLLIVVALAVLVGIWLALDYLRPESATEAREPEATIDAGAEPDSGTVLDGGGEEERADGTASLSPHEREEAAKDELARARGAIRSGDLDAARLALDAAEALDPSNPDIEELRSKILGAGPDGG